MKCAGLWSFVLLTLWPLSLHGQELVIGQMHYRLGMTMNEVQAATHDPISLEKLANNTWLVDENRGEESSPIGLIIFMNGRVERLEREFKGFTTKEEKDVGNALFQAVERLKRDDPNASVNAVSRFVSSADGEFKKITIGTRPRRIEISIPDSETVEMSIREVLSLASHWPTQPPTEIALDNISATHLPAG